MTEQVERQHEDVVAETILLEDALEEVYLELTSDELRRFQQWVLHKKSEIAKWTVTEKISVLWVLQNKLKRRGLVSLREHSTIEILRYIFRNPAKAKAWLSHQFKNVEVGRSDRNLGSDYNREEDGPISITQEGRTSGAGKVGTDIYRGQRKKRGPSGRNVLIPAYLARENAGKTETKSGLTVQTVESESSWGGSREISNGGKNRSFDNSKFYNKYRYWDISFEFLTPEDAFRYLADRAGFGDDIDAYKKAMRTEDFEIAEELRKYRAELARKRKQKQRAKLPKSSRGRGRPKGSKDKTPRTRTVWKRSDAEKNVEIIDVPESPNRLQNARCDLCATQTNLRKMLDKFGEEVYLCESCIEHSIERDTYHEIDETSEDRRLAL